jgi:hypothetical protein
MSSLIRALAHLEQLTSREEEPAKISTIKVNM